MDKTETEIRTEMQAKYAIVRAHNERMMEEAGVPSDGHTPRRGFYRATRGHDDYILKIERVDHTRTNGKVISFWKLDTSPWPPDDQPRWTTLNHGWIVGPRGKLTQSW